VQLCMLWMLLGSVGISVFSKGAGYGGRLRRFSRAVK